MKKLLLLVLIVLTAGCSRDYLSYDNEFYYFNPKKPDVVYKTEMLEYDNFKDKYALINGEYVHISIEYMEEHAVVTFAIEKPFDIIYFGGYKYDNVSEKMKWDNKGSKGKFVYVTKAIPYSKLEQPDCDDGYYYFMLSQKHH